MCESYNMVYIGQMVHFTKRYKQQVATVKWDQPEKFNFTCYILIPDTLLYNRQEDASFEEVYKKLWYECLGKSAYK